MTIRQWQNGILDFTLEHESMIASIDMKSKLERQYDDNIKRRRTLLENREIDLITTVQNLSIYYPSKYYEL